jgi:hypothetical protein
MTAIATATAIVRSKRVSIVFSDWAWGCLFAISAMREVGDFTRPKVNLSSS